MTDLGRGFVRGSEDMIMENEVVVETATVLRGGSSRQADDQMAGGTTGWPGMERSPLSMRPASLEICPDPACTNSGWHAPKRRFQMPCASELDLGNASAATLRPGSLNRLSWEGTVPVSARSLAPSLPGALAPDEFAITELRGVSKAGLNEFVHATSYNGKPLYTAYGKGSQGELCLQQLFEFSQTAHDAGVFLPVPAFGGRYQGVYGLEYARHRFIGSIASIPEILKLPAGLTSGFLHPPNSTPHALVEEVPQPAATAITPAPSIAIPDDSGNKCEDSLVIISSPRPSSPSRAGEMPNRPSAVSGFVNPSCRDYASSYQEPPPQDALDVVANSAPPCKPKSSCTSEGESPIAIKNGDEPPQQGVQQPHVDTTLATADSSASEERIPDRCLPWLLCAACQKFWGMIGLPEKHFETGAFRPPREGTPAILSSAKTAARKRKWTQCRHGPKSKTSEYRGVNLYKRTWKWEAHIWYNGEQIYLGASSTKVHAAKVYDRAALFLFGPDTEINFEPEEYQEEYEFMLRLSFGQMVTYLRRASRENGEEVRYPGVANVKNNVFSASYRPRKERESHEHIGYFKTEEDAVRAVLKEAKRRRNYEMAAKIVDVHHLRIVRPATGKIKQKRSKSRAASTFAALELVGSRPPTRASKRAQRAAARATSAIRTQAAAPPALEVEVAPPPRRRTSRIPISDSAEAVKDSTPTVLRPNRVPGSQADWQDPGSETTALTRTYVRKSSKAKVKIVTREEIIEPASVGVEVEERLHQNASAVGKRKNSLQPKSSPAAKKRSRGRAALTRSLRDVVMEVGPAELPAPPRRNLPRLCNFASSTPVSIASRPPELTNVSSTPVLPTVTVSPPDPVTPPHAPFPVVVYRERPFIANPAPFPRANTFRSVSASTGSKIGSHHESETPGYAADGEGEWTGTPESRESGVAGSRCRSFPTAGLTAFKYAPSPVALEEAKAEAIRQFQEACDGLITRRRSTQLHGYGEDNPRLPESQFSTSMGVIRPVARRLSLASGVRLQPGEPVRSSSGAAAAAAEASANLVSPGRNAAAAAAAEGQLYVDLFGVRLGV